MSPPRENNGGAVPLVRLAELDSGIHHIREQTDMDRRAQAERNRDMADTIARIDAATQANTVAVAGIVASLGTVKHLVALAVALVPVCIGVAWTLGRLIR